MTARSIPPQNRQSRSLDGCSDECAFVEAAYLAGRPIVSRSLTEGQVLATDEPAGNGGQCATASLAFMATGAL